MKHAKLILVLLMAAVLITPVASVTVSFDNATCGIHIQKDIQVNGGQIRINASDFPETNCSVVVSTNEYTTTPSYYDPRESTVTYSEEYYRLGKQSDTYITFVLNLIDQMIARANNMYDAKLQLSQIYELRRQTILMEKQNELLEEQNGLLRNATYPKYKCVLSDKQSLVSPYYCEVVK